MQSYFWDTTLAYLIDSVVILSITGWCVWMAKRVAQVFLTSWLYYVITLLPVLGIIQVGEQAAADRYTYLPSISVFLIIGVCAGRAWEKISLPKSRNIFRGVLMGCGGLVLVILSSITISQIKIWKDPAVLWTSVIHSSPVSVSIAHNNLGLAYFSKGMLDEAIAEYKQALTINPKLTETHYNLGLAYDTKGMLDEAIAEYKQALTINPHYAPAHNNLSAAYYDKGNYKLAIIHCDKALELGYIVNQKLLELLMPYR